MIFMKNIVLSIRKFLRGGYSFGISFWVFGLIFYFSLGFLNLFFEAVFRFEKIYALRGYPTMLVSSIFDFLLLQKVRAIWIKILYSIFAVIWLVGIKESHAQNPKVSPLFSYSARIFSVVIVLDSFWQILKSF